MAIKIKETPILTGKDAKTFMKKMHEVDNHKGDYYTKEEISKMKSDYEWIMSIAKKTNTF